MRRFADDTWRGDEILDGIGDTPTLARQRWTASRAVWAITLAQPTAGGTGDGICATRHGWLTA